MKRKRLTQLIYIPTSLVIIILAILFVWINDSIIKTGTSTTEVDDEVPNAINHLLTNEFSDLKETKKLDSQIEKFIKEWRIKGASIAIMKDEKLIYAKGYGWANEEESVSTEVKHIFRIASVSKLITAAGVMKLCEDGDLKLNSKVFGDNGILNLPQFQNIKDKRINSITIENLLRHQGGFSLRGGDPMFITLDIKRRLGLDTVPDKDHVIAYAISKGLGFAPGKGTRYSNIGYLILSRVIEEVTGKSYETYIKDSILSPAGCFDMHIAKNSLAEKFPNEVKYYEPENENLVEAFDGSNQMCQRCYGGNNIEGLYGAGAWVASPSELLKFVASIDGKPNVHDILTIKSIRYMTKSNSSLLPIGWAKTNDNGDWTRSGTLSGTSALVKYQKDGYSWVFVTNTSSWKGARFPRQIDGFFKNAIKKVSFWPDRDLFNLLKNHKLIQ